jgi:hypothetical protein
MHPVNILFIILQNFGIFAQIGTCLSKRLLSAAARRPATANNVIRILVCQYHHRYDQQAKWEKHLILDVVMLLVQIMNSNGSIYTDAVNHTIECCQIQPCS